MQKTASEMRISAWSSDVCSSDLIAARQQRFGRPFFAEAFIDGREFNLSVLETAGGPRVLPVAEILFVDFPPGRPRIVDYEAKWAPESDAYANTPRRFDLAADDAALAAELSRLALDARHLVGLAGYARLDFRVDAAGRPPILEVNLDRKSPRLNSSH